MTSEIKATVQALVDALEDLVALDFYETDCDGHVVPTCPACGKQAGEHNKYCDFVTAQAALLAGQQLLAHEGEPVAWSFELATAISGEGYCGWEKRLSFKKPEVPDDSIRNLTPLYAAAAPQAQQEQEPDDSDINQVHDANAAVTYPTMYFGAPPPVQE